MEYKIEDFFAALDERHTAEVRKKLWDARVGIAGIGGLGSNTATALARTGVGHIHIEYQSSGIFLPPCGAEKDGRADGNHT